MATRRLLPLSLGLGAASYAFLTITNITQFGVNLFTIGRIMFALGVALAAAPLFREDEAKPARLFPIGFLVSSLGAVLSFAVSLQFRIDAFNAGLLILALSLFVASAASKRWLQTGDEVHANRLAGAFMVMAGAQGILTITNALDLNAIDTLAHFIALLCFVAISQTIATELASLPRAEPPTG
ncbi:MAG: hypothetical protein HY556_07130 [Euryarchaeota archaeon]|nr:hypothetical protein [Euryarchaeota archaeon]